MQKACGTNNLDGKSKGRELPGFFAPSTNILLSDTCYQLIAIKCLRFVKYPSRSESIF